MTVAQFGLDDAAARAEYDALFEASPSAHIQQSTYWAEAIRHLGPDEPKFLLARSEGEAVAGLPLYLFRAEHGNIVTSIPQAGPHGGVFTRSDIDEESRSAARAALLACSLEVARATESIALTVLTSPFGDRVEEYSDALAPTFLFENFSQSIPVGTVVGADGIRWEALSYRGRKNIKRALQLARSFGFQQSWSTSEEDLRDWYQVHVARHTSIGAQPLPYELLRSLLATLAPHGKAGLLLLRDGDRIASGALYVWHRETMDVFMVSMDEEYAIHSPNYLLTEQSLLWAAERGVVNYNWQSSPRREGGVYEYKKRWGSEDYPYFFVTTLFDSAERIAALGPDAIRAAYPWHYVVPFGAFEKGFDQKHFAK